MARSYALLVGVDEYSMLDPKYGLSGCVSDAQLIKSVLLKSFGFVEEDCVELHNKSASRERILKEMQGLIDKSEDGDRVFFHFSGHGSQRTCLDESEGTGLDSTIMSADSGRDPHPNLDIADDEIGEWLEQLSGKTDNITLIFDCCHSGTITRDPFAATARAVPTDNRSIEAMGLSPRARRTAARELSGGSFLPRSDAYVVMSGCRDNEYSNEYTQEKEGATLRHGALTYCLSQALLAARAGSTYQDIFEQASGKVSSLFPSQHPQIEGRRDRVLFGTDLVEPLKYFTLAKVGQTNATLNGGAAHGVEAGSTWAVYPAGTNNTDAVEPVAHLTVDKVTALTATASITNRTTELSLDCRCVLENAPGHIPAMKIDTSSLDEEWKNDVDAALDSSALLAVANTAEQADMCLSSAGENWTALGKDGLAALPQQALQNSGDLSRLLENLETRASARNVFALGNSASKLKADFNIYRSADRENWEKVDENTIFVEGDSVAFELVNREKKPLFLSVLDIGLTGRVALFYPGGGSSELIEPGQILKVGFNDVVIQLGLPKGYEQDRGRETFKAIISTDETGFSWLQQSGTRSVGLPSQLQQMMERAYEGGKTRDVMMTAAAPMEDWLTINRSFELRRA